VLRVPPDLSQLAAEIEQRLDQVVAHAVARLDACYEALSGAAMYASTQHAQQAQQRHLRGTVNAYFERDEELTGGGGSTGVCLQGAAGAGGDSRMDQQQQQEDEEEEQGMGTGYEGESSSSWGVGPVQRPPQDTLRRQLRALLASDRERFAGLGRQRLTGLVVARIAAGLGSPAFSVQDWGKTQDWGRWGGVDFKWLLAAAEAEVAAFWEQQQRDLEDGSV
jgi:hypothetical protein